MPDGRSHGHRRAAVEQAWPAAPQDSCRAPGHRGDLRAKMFAKGGRLSPSPPSWSWRTTTAPAPTSARCCRASTTTSPRRPRVRRPWPGSRPAPLPALVLLDLILPGLAGVAVLDHIRSAHPALPVIVLSTVAQLKTVVDAVKRGASDYLTKPFAGAGAGARDPQRAREADPARAGEVAAAAARGSVRASPSPIEPEHAAHPRDRACRWRTPTRPCSSSASRAWARRCSRGSSTPSRAAARSVS